ncbi:hypothetical protein WKS02_000137 [Yersinia enterocolitica]
MDNIDRDEYFDLFDMKEILALNGFISSSGATGLKALQKGDNVDRSRDAIYNQCKMYAEVYRSLGWVGSVDKALDYYITPFGRHVLNSKVKPQLIFEHCLLGIENPNDILVIPRKYRLRPFLAILKCARELEGYMSKEEMIYGPLFLSDDSNLEEIDSTCKEILQLRNDKTEFKNKLEAKYIEREITANTASNYTRFPIAAIQFVGWFTKKNGCFHLTEYGYNALYLAEKKNDFRYIDISDDIFLDDLSKFSYYDFLLNHGYNLGNLAIDHEQAKKNLPKEITEYGTLFSPFSVMNSKRLSQIFNFMIPSTKRKTSVELTDKYNNKERVNTIVPFKFTVNTSNIDNKYSNRLKELIASQEEKHVIKLIKDEVRLYKKDKFYPWVSDVFAIIGINCNIPQHGNNSVRWDAILLNQDNTDSIPIELKSPTEELHLSVKAIRQALENKIVLQSRKVISNAPTSSSLAIGFELPNKRSEVDALISAFYNIFGFSVAVISTEYLIKLTIECVKEEKKLDFTDFSCLRGIIYE